MLKYDPATKHKLYKKKELSNEAKKYDKNLQQSGLAHIEMIVIGVVIAGLIGLLGFVGWSTWQNKNGENKADAATCTKRVYKKGSRSTCVKHAQILLNYFIKQGAPEGGSSLTEDGIFGTNTQKAVKGFQKYWKLSQDGVIGNETWRVLCYPQKGGIGSSIKKSWGNNKAYNAARAAGCY
jgi:hypothetical protein